MATLSERFWSKVEKTDSCWTWTAACDRHGYGIFHIPNAVGKWVMHGAHRACYILTRGGIPDGLQVLHRCDNPKCVRPDHLFLGTHQDNVDDMVAKGRNPRGSRTGRAKLTEADIPAIRYAYRFAGVSTRKLATAMGVTRRVIQNVLQGKNWTHA